MHPSIHPSMHAVRFIATRKYHWQLIRQVAACCSCCCCGGGVGNGNWALGSIAARTATKTASMVSAAGAFAIEKGFGWMQRRRLLPRGFRPGLRQRCSQRRRGHGLRWVPLSKWLSTGDYYYCCCVPATAGLVSARMGRASQQRSVSISFPARRPSSLSCPRGPPPLPSAGPVARGTGENTTGEPSDEFVASTRRRRCRPGTSRSYCALPARQRCVCVCFCSLACESVAAAVAATNPHRHGGAGR
mmetsp:Transcript_22353/g.62204  ORF Transcript_22353/g.62204 Transcript_22353/m.62204 type:complete len:245 (+) Transcript_22353:362-1096(+)